MKKKIVLLLISSVVLTFVGCGGKSSETKSEEATVTEAPEETPEATETQEVTDTPETTETPEATDTPEATPASEVSTGIRPEFKEAMDSYEAFINQYAEFMASYNSSDDQTSMLSEYADYMAQYSETMDKMNKLNEEEMSDEELVYYTEVTGRINTKLAEIATSID